MSTRCVCESDAPVESQGDLWLVRIEVARSHARHRLHIRSVKVQNTLIQGHAFFRIVQSIVDSCLTQHQGYILCTSELNLDACPDISDTRISSDKSMCSRDHVFVQQT